MTDFQTEKRGLHDSEVGRKVIPLDEAASLVRNGSHMCFSGFAHSLAPMAFVREMIRQEVSELEITAMGEAWVVDVLSGAGALRTVRFSNFMFEGWGRCRNFSREVEEGRLRVEDYSHFGITNRFFASSVGLPFMPTKVIMGTDIYRIRSIEGEEKFYDFEDPFTGEKVLLVPSVRPDFAVIHASRADRNGNTQLIGISPNAELIAKASEKVIVTVEDIVEEDVIRRDPSHTILPSFLVDAVVHAPYGAHPAGMYRYYDYDPEHIDLYVEASRSPESFSTYLDEYVLGLQDETEYLRKIGLTRLLELRADPYFGYSLKVRGIND
jgi:glutaconate CoA-transferase, subunit A